MARYLISHAMGVLGPLVAPRVASHLPWCAWSHHGRRTRSLALRPSSPHPLHSLHSPRPPHSLCSLRTRALLSHAPVRSTHPAHFPCPSSPPSSLTRSPLCLSVSLSLCLSVSLSTLSLSPQGVLLCKVMNALEPGVIRKIHASKMPFKQMENISQFMQVRGSTIIIFSISVSVATYIYTAKRNHPHRDLTP